MAASRAAPMAGRMVPYWAAKTAAASVAEMVVLSAMRKVGCWAVDWELPMAGWTDG